MRRSLAVLATAAAAALVLAAPASALKVADPTPTATFSDGTNAGYVEVDESGAIRACNENDQTPAGDDLSGYAYVSASGESFESGPTYGNENIGAGDTDGEGTDSPGPDGVWGTEDDEINSHDCP